MKAAFECATHFKTYNGERNPSFSANCNALHALASDIEHQSNKKHDLMVTIEKVVSFLCQRWWAWEDFPVDKWVRSTAFCLCLTLIYLYAECISLLFYHVSSTKLLCAS